MKNFLFLLISLFLIVSISAQEEQSQRFKHIEIEAGVGFWTPISPDIMNTSSVYTIHTDFGDYKVVNVSGFGYGFYPSLKLKYFFKNNLGVALSFSNTIAEMKWTKALTTLQQSVTTTALNLLN